MILCVVDYLRWRVLLIVKRGYSQRKFLIVFRNIFELKLTHTIFSRKKLINVENRERGVDKIIFQKFWRLSYTSFEISSEDIKKQKSSDDTYHQTMTTHLLYHSKQRSWTEWSLKNKTQRKTKKLKLITLSILKKKTTTCKPKVIQASRCAQCQVFRAEQQGSPSGVRGAWWHTESTRAHKSVAGTRQTRESRNCWLRVVCACRAWLNDRKQPTETHSSGSKHSHSAQDFRHDAHRQEGLPCGEHEDFTAQTEGYVLLFLLLVTRQIWGSVYVVALIDIVASIIFFCDLRLKENNIFIVTRSVGKSFELSSRRRNYCWRLLLMISYI